jgi:uncharacterized protein YndB with AHSA1/START domain
LGRHRFKIRIAAPTEQVFDLYTNLDRIHEWTGGVTGVADVSGPPGEAGTTYTVLFGRMSSPTMVLAAERPRLFKTHFGNRVLRGTSEARFAPDGEDTLVTQEFQTEGLLPGLMGRVFSVGSHKGTFRGELMEFARICEREAQHSSSAAQPS